MNCSHHHISARMAALSVLLVVGVLAQACFGGDSGGGNAGTPASAGASGGAGTSGGTGGSGTGGTGTGGTTGTIVGAGGSGIAGDGVAACDCNRVCGGFANASDCPGNECECPPINCGCDAICAGETSQAACPGDVECVCEPATNDCAPSGDELWCPTQEEYCANQCGRVALPCPVDGTCLGILQDCDCTADACDLGLPIGGSVCNGIVAEGKCFDRMEDACACAGCTFPDCVRQETVPPQVFCHWEKP